MGNNHKDPKKTFLEPSKTHFGIWFFKLPKKMLPSSKNAERTCFSCKYPQGSQIYLFGTPKNAHLDLNFFKMPKKMLSSSKNAERTCFCCKYPQGSQKCLFGTPQKLQFWKSLKPPVKDFYIKNRKVYRFCSLKTKFPWKSSSYKCAF